MKQQHAVINPYSQPMFVDGNFLDQIPALDADFLLRYEVLYDDVSHVLPVSVALLVQAVNRREYELIVGYGTVLTTHGLYSKMDGRGGGGLVQVVI